jgi:hypothetical protein
MVELPKQITLVGLTFFDYEMGSKVVCWWQSFHRGSLCQQLK